MAATGLVTEGGSGFSSITEGHDARLCALRMIDFAKGALAHSRTIEMPGERGQPVLVSSLAYVL